MTSGPGDSGSNVTQGPWENVAPVMQRSAGGGGYGGMEGERITRLEVEFSHVRKDLDGIQSDLKSVLTHLTELPTKTELRGNLQWIVGVSAAVLALFVGVLAYLQDQRIAVGGSSDHAPPGITIQVQPGAVQISPLPPEPPKAP